MVVTDAVTGAASGAAESVALLDLLRAQIGRRTMATTPEATPGSQAVTMDTLYQIKADPAYYEPTPKGDGLRKEAERVSRVLAGEPTAG